MSTRIIADQHSDSGEQHSGSVEHRQQPQDLGAEQSVLGAMMLSQDAIGECLEIVKPWHFYRPAHQTIYECLLDMYGAGTATDAITLGSALEQRRELDKVGGAPYLHTLIATVPTATNATFYADIVAEKALDRRTVEAGVHITELGYRGRVEQETSTADMARAAVDAIDADREDGTSIFVGEGYADVLAELDTVQQHARNDELYGVPSGFTDLDAVTNGFQAGQFIIAAGRPGMGKSTLGLDFCRAASIENNIPTAIFSLEMGRNEIIMRMLAAEARVRLGDMRGGRMTPDDWQRLQQLHEKISQAPIILDDSPDLNLQKIRARARKLRQRHNVGLILVDYMQLMTSGKKVESRQQEVSEFSRNLKLLAKELEVPVVAISQLNRGPEQRQEHQPSLADLRESGSLEQDADMVLLIHRPDSYNQESPRSGEADLIVAKHRAGPQATITVAHQLHYCRFVSMAMEPEKPAPDAAFARAHVENIKPVAVTGHDTPSSAPAATAARCRGCHDLLANPAEVASGYHAECEDVASGG